MFYIGSYYLGYQRQPHSLAIENFLENAFIGEHLICCFKLHGYRSVSRTDAGVNALGNVFVIGTNHEPVLEKINSKLPKNGSIIVWAKLPIQKEMQLKPVKYKIYQYFYPHKVYNSTKLKLIDFIGTYDFTPFIKKDKKAIQNNICTLYSFTVESTPTGLLFQIVGDHFGWEQIRRMLGFLVNKKLAEAEILPVLQKQTKYNAIPLPGYFLTLHHIELPVDREWAIANVSFLIKRTMEKNETTLSLIELKNLMMANLLQMLQNY